MKIYCITAICILLLSGCGTTPIPSSKANIAPKERLVAFQEKTSDTTSTLIVTRDVGMVGSGCYIALSINGVLAARLAAGETSSFYLKPGEILLRSGVDPYGKGLCGYGKDFYWTQRETILRLNETKFFRLSIDSNGNQDIQRGE